MHIFCISDNSFNYFILLLCNYSFCEKIIEMILFQLMEIINSVKIEIQPEYILKKL